MSTSLMYLISVEDLFETLLQNCGINFLSHSLIGIHDVYKSQEVEHISANFRLGPNNRKLNVAAYNRPCKRTDQVYLDNSVKEFAHIREKKQRNILIAGRDFNAPGIYWFSFTIEWNQYLHRVSQSVLLLDILSNSNMVQLVIHIVIHMKSPFHSFFNICITYAKYIKYHII